MRLEFSFSMSIGDRYYVFTLSPFRWKWGPYADGWSWWVGPFVFERG